MYVASSGRQKRKDVSIGSCVSRRQLSVYPGHRTRPAVACAIGCARHEQVRKQVHFVPGWPAQSNFRCTACVARPFPGQGRLQQCAAARVAPSCCRRSGRCIQAETQQFERFAGQSAMVRVEATAAQLQRGVGRVTLLAGAPAADSGPVN